STSVSSDATATTPATTAPSAPAGTTAPSAPDADAGANGDAEVCTALRTFALDGVGPIQSFSAIPITADDVHAIFDPIEPYLPEFPDGFIDAYDTIRDAAERAVGVSEEEA